MPLPESLLSSRVPDLQLDRLAAHVYYPGAELHADGVVGVLFDCSRDAEARTSVRSRLGTSSSSVALVVVCGGCL